MQLVNNQNRAQLSAEWFGRDPELQHAEYVIEKTPDLLISFRAAMFPAVSTHLLTIAHPLCEHGTLTVSTEKPGNLVHWRRIWMDALEQAAAYPGQIFVLRLEDLSNRTR